MKCGWQRVGGDVIKEAYNVHMQPSPCKSPYPDDEERYNSGITMGQKSTLTRFLGTNQTASLFSNLQRSRLTEWNVALPVVYEVSLEEVVCAMIKTQSPALVDT